MKIKIQERAYLGHAGCNLGLCPTFKINAEDLVKFSPQFGAKLKLFLLCALG